MDDDWSYRYNTIASVWIVLFTGVREINDWSADD